MWVTWLQVLALLQTDCMVLGKTISAKVMSTVSTTLGRAASCDNHVREDELHRLGRLRGWVSTSAALHFPEERDGNLFVPQTGCFSGANPLCLPSCSLTEQSSRALTAQSRFLFLLMHWNVSFWKGRNLLENTCDLWLLQPEEIIYFKAGRFTTLLSSFGWRKTNLIQGQLF